MPPDPIADIDPWRAGQMAKVGMLARIKRMLDMAEASGKNIERIERVATAFGRIFSRILERWANFSDGGGV